MSSTTTTATAAVTAVSADASSGPLGREACADAVAMLWAEVEAGQRREARLQAELRGAREAAAAAQRQLGRLRLDEAALAWMGSSDVAELQAELRALGRKAARRLEELASAEPPPHEYVCAITAGLMLDPVIARDGHTYERAAIETCFRAYPRQTPSPATGEVLASHDLLPNVMLRGVLQLLRTCRRPAADQ